ncbi:MAG: cytochrome c biogenesis protein ResB, partial [Chloroflexi bacterium]|nr:cytochrome c biogenesis protein ResB [Chloroflexota bacterium]
GTNLSLKLESIVDEYWPEGPPKDYRSQVVLYENGQEVQQGVLRVNHPMSYKGVRFYQSFFGQAVVTEVRDQSGQTLERLRSY